MILMAYPTASLLLHVLLTQDSATCSAKFPANLPKAVIFACDAANTAETEAGKRRATWLALASMLKLVSQKQADPLLNEEVARIWMTLFAAQESLRFALENNILFDEQEKAFFEPLADEMTFQASVTAVAPRHLRDCTGWDKTYL